VPFARRISRTRSGSFRVRLPGPERELLVSLAEQLRTVLAVSTDDPMVRRLFPTAYHDDPERDHEYQALVRDELLDRRLATLEALEASAEAEELDEEGLSVWMAAINDLRLVLGTRLDVSNDPDRVDLDDPMAPAMAAYEYLGFLLHEVVEALTGSLPPPTQDGPE
jgi:hypothetical protein